MLGDDFKISQQNSLAVKPPGVLAYLLVQVSEVELATGRVRHILVVLLQHLHTGVGNEWFDGEKVTGAGLVLFVERGRGAAGRHAMLRCAAEAVLAARG